MDWTTVILMSAIFYLGIAFNAGSYGLLSPHATEPFLSYQAICFGLNCVVASIVPFCRNHSITAWVTLGLGAFFLLLGLGSLLHYHRTEARQ